MTFGRIVRISGQALTHGLHMLTQLKNWLGIGKTGNESARVDASGYQPGTVRRTAPATPQTRGSAGGPASRGERRQGDRRRQQTAGDTDRVPTLSLLDDDAGPESGSAAGFDPYNTGDFDRSRNWERRFRD